MDAMRATSMEPRSFSVHVVYEGECWHKYSFSLAGRTPELQGCCACRSLTFLQSMRIDEKTDQNLIGAFVSELQRGKEGSLMVSETTGKEVA
jgi:hypothetical protein